MKAITTAAALATLALMAPGPTAASEATPQAVGSVAVATSSAGVGYRGATIKQSTWAYTRSPNSKWIRKKYVLRKGTTTWKAITNNGRLFRSNFTGSYETCPNGKRPYYFYKMLKVDYSSGISKYNYLVPACKVSVW